MSGFDQSSIAVPMPTVVGAAAALGGPYKIKPSEAFSGALMTVSGLTGETISVETSPDGYWGAPANPSFYRTDWQGTSLLYPSARTNYLLYSNDLTNIYWTKNATTIDVPLYLGPDGTTTANKILETATTAAHNVTRSSPVGLSLGAATVSFADFAPSGRDWVRFSSDGGAVVAFFNVSTGQTGTVAGCTASITTLPNGYYRCAVLYTPATSTSLIWGLSSNGSLSSYLGDAGLGVFGTNFNSYLGTVLTPHIPTSGAAATITDYTISGGVITLAQTPVSGALLSYDNSVLPSPYYIFATGDGVRTAFSYDGVWGTLSANSGKGNGIWQIDLRGAQAYRLVKSAGSETATVNMTLKRDALQYTNSAGTWSVT